MAKRHLPKGFHTVNLYLTVDGAAKQIDFLKQAFDAEEVMRMDMPDGKIAHAALQLGDSMIETADSNDNWKATTASIHLYVPDTDAAYERALAAGAESLRAPADMFYGERGASVRDPLGNQWHIATLLEELSQEEIERRAAELHH